MKQADLRPEEAVCGEAATANESEGATGRLGAPQADLLNRDQTRSCLIYVMLCYM